MADPDPFESVSPLPQDVRRSLIALVCVGMTSLVTTTLLLVHITYSLVRWKLRDVRRRREELAQAVRPALTPGVDLQLGLTEQHYYQATTRGKPGPGEVVVYISPEQQQQQQQVDLERTETTLSSPAGSSPSPSPPQPQSAGAAGTTTTTTSSSSPSVRRRGEKPPNPLLVLIYNLLLADAMLSAAYANDAVWLSIDGIIAPSLTCSAQGWIVSFGCLTTSGFLFTISVFSYLGIIRGYKATPRDVLVACSTIWIMSVFLSTVGPVYFHDDDSFYGRETNWCWIADKHKLWRLSVYLWGFPLLTAAGCIYGLIFYRLWQEGRSSRFMPRRRAGSSTTDRSGNSSSGYGPATTTTTAPRLGAAGNNTTPLRPSGHHPAFLIYPCIYMATGTPLMLGSLIPALERSPAFMGTAGALLASTGLLDTILWSSIVLFSRREDLRNTGLDQFAFMRTPEGRTLGNIVFVQGGRGGARAADRSLAGAEDEEEEEEGARYHNRHHHRQSWHSRKKKDKGWWRLGDRQNEQASLSQERLPDVSDGIQMEVVTSVVVERGVPDGQHVRNFSRDDAKSMESM